MTAVMDPQVADPDVELEDGKASHIVVPASKVTEAYVTGAAVEALCGHVFVPTRDPKRYPVCPACDELLAAFVLGSRGYEPRNGT